MTDPNTPEPRASDPLSDTDTIITGPPGDGSSAPPPPPPAAGSANTLGPPGPLPPPGSPPPPGAPDATSDDGASLPLRADPDRPADSGWREPPWIPARDGDDRRRQASRANRPNPAALVVGLVLILIGLWFFAERTLGISLPRIAWSTVWPLILIVLGAVILWRAVERRP
jgi:hypothetical protein